MAGIVFLIRIVCVVIGFYMAGQKGRNEFVWGIICLFFGLIGVLIIAVIEPISKPQDSIRERKVTLETQVKKKLHQSFL